MKIKLLFFYLFVAIFSIVDAYADSGDHKAQAFGLKYWDGELVQYGSMHEAIGRKQYQGRISLDEINERRHFYGVAALEQLKGEITFFDSSVTVTSVDKDGRLKPLNEDRLQATLLAGAYVPAWNEHRIDQDVLPAVFDDFIRDKALESAFDMSKPFVFTLEGEFINVRLHVINGACPMHARLRNIEIAPESKPFEDEYANIYGKVVGIYASNAVGNLTHPDTATHIHLIFKDDSSGETVTGHLEQVGIKQGSILNLPQIGDMSGMLD